MPQASLISIHTIMPFSQTLKKGFTLIETIIGLLVFAIALSIVTTLLIPAEENSADQIHQAKAAQLAKALLSDILSRSFDENSDRDGGIYRCDEDKNLDGAIDNDTERCTLENGVGGWPQDLGEGSRSDFDDVDDFDGFTTLINATDQALDASYGAFTLTVDVVYAGDDINIGSLRGAKRITVIVTTPLGTDIRFSAYKANF